MEFTKEEENFIRAVKTVVDDLQSKLRSFFKQSWNAKKGQTEPAWSDSTSDGKKLLNTKKSSLKLNKVQTNLVKSGDTNDWDASCLFEVILAVLDTNVDKKERSSISKLRTQRNMIHHKKSGALTQKEMDTFFSKVQKEYMNMKWSYECVEKYKKDRMETEEMKKLKNQLESEKKKALKENQENLCILPKRIINFVGREKEMETSREIMSKDENFLAITGGPCYGKSSLANELGHSMFEDPYNYVVWVNMRDLPSSPPSLEDIALKILKEFEIDTSLMKEEILNSLVMKFELITASNKTALLIFDNADELLSPQDVHCRSSVYIELCRYIRESSRQSIRAVFTTRLHKPSNQNTDLHTINLTTLSDKESEKFIRLQLEEKKCFDVKRLITDIVQVSGGLPFALQLICSNVIEMNCTDMIDDYVNALMQNPLNNLSMDSRPLHNLFDLSLKYLQGKNDNFELFLSLLAVFPSRFSYKYVKKLLVAVGYNDINAFMIVVLKNHSLLQDDSRVYEASQEDTVLDKLNQDDTSPNEASLDKTGPEKASAGITSRDKTSNNEFYMIHPFFRQYIKEKFWSEDVEKKHESAYYRLYSEQLFVLVRGALAKDKYVECLKEFKAEQHNFFHMMNEVANGFETFSCSSYHLKEVLGKVLQRDTPNYIATCLFCIDVASPSLLLTFLQGCEALVPKTHKKNIWCCRYDLHMKYFEQEIDDLYKDMELDVYGQALMTKRALAKRIHRSSVTKLVEEDFSKITSDLDAFSKRVNGLESLVMRAYFKHKIHKLKGNWLKKWRKFPSLDVKKDCVNSFKEALKICQVSFGKNWLTIDCHNQLGKVFWLLEENVQARQAFDNAIEVAESMKLTNHKKFGSCLLDKGRFLIDPSINKEKEGIALLQDVLDRCEDFSDTKFWCLAMDSLLEVDRSSVVKVKEYFIQTKNLSPQVLSLMKKAIKLDWNSCDSGMNEESFKEYEEAKVSDLKNAIKKLESMLCSEILGGTRDDNDGTDLRNDVKKCLYLWQVQVALKCNHVLLLSERKEFARKALEILGACQHLHDKKKEELQTLVKSDFDHGEEKMLLEMYFLNRISELSLEEGMDIKLMQRSLKLLKENEGNQKIWCLIALKISRNWPNFYEEVKSYLLRQGEPCEDLLKLVRHKFDYQINIYEREADEIEIMKESERAVNDLILAIKYVENLLLQKDTMTKDVVDRLEDNLWYWYKHIALNSGHYLILNRLKLYAQYALMKPFKLNAKDKKRLHVVESSNIPEDEQEKVRGKQLLIRVTKYMRENGMQDELEKRYEAFLADCWLFPRVRLDMVKFIINYDNVKSCYFNRYLKFLCRHFQDGSLNKGWDYQFVIDISDKLFSNSDRLSQLGSFQTYIAIYDSLRDSNIPSNVKRKLNFQFLVIFSLKIDSGIRDIKTRQGDALCALDIFRSLDGKFQRELSKDIGELKEFIRQ